MYTYASIFTCVIV
jgi:hypothetical protein